MYEVRSGLTIIAQTDQFISAPDFIKITINCTAVQNINLTAHKGVIIQTLDMDMDDLQQTVYL